MKVEAKYHWGTCSHVIPCPKCHQNFHVIFVGRPKVKCTHCRAAGWLSVTTDLRILIDFPDGDRYQSTFDFAIDLFAPVAVSLNEGLAAAVRQTIHEEYAATVPWEPQYLNSQFDTPGPF